MRIKKKKPRPRGSKGARASMTGSAKAAADKRSAQGGGDEGDGE